MGPRPLALARQGDLLSRTVSIWPNALAVPPWSRAGQIGDARSLGATTRLPNAAASLDETAQPRQASNDMDVARSSDAT